MTGQAEITRQYQAIQAVETARASQQGLHNKGVAAMKALHDLGFTGDPAEFTEMSDGDRDLIRRMAQYAARPE